MYSHHSLCSVQLPNCDGFHGVLTPLEIYVKCNALLFLCSTKPLCGGKMDLFVKGTIEVNEANKGTVLGCGQREREITQAK